ncbi:MAG TPA: rhombotarget lipoprotein [Steroidobacteraceae bacterium]|nr:rhombotarget lipoprotein [Steroidobacteraceae bacterium]
MNKWFSIVVAATTMTLGGCASLMCPMGCGPARSHNSSTLVDFLYPDGRMPEASTTMPQLAIPLRVGLAFLPSANAQATGLDAAHRQQLLERIRQRFASRRFVSEIVLVPDYYLSGHRGFAGLDAVQHLYNLDVMALVSFDQESHLDSNEWSLAYLTIIGSYVIKGSRHDVSTLVDLAVIDPATRQLLLRAGGTDSRHGNTTLIDANRSTREADSDGFSAATDRMIEHFDTELVKFEAQVRAGTAPVRVVSRNEAGHGGGGTLDGWILGLLMLVLARRAAGHSRKGGGIVIIGGR